MISARKLGLLGSHGWSLHSKTLVLVLGGILIAGAVILMVSLGRTGEAVRGQVQEKFALAATSKLASVADVLTESFTVLRGIAADAQVLAACEAANAEHTAGYAAYLGEMNQRWMQSDDDSQLIQSVINAETNAANAQLQRHLAGLPQYVEVLVTDSLGATVAASQRGDLYYHASSLWWTSLHNAGQGQSYIGIYRSRGDTDTYAAYEMAIPIYRDVATQQTVLGTVYARIRAEALLKAIRSANPTAAAQTLIIDERAQTILAVDRDQVGAIVDSSWWQQPYVLNRQAHFHEAQMLDDTPVLLGHASMSDLDVDHPADSITLKGLGWILYVYEPTRSAYAVVRQMTTVLWIWGAAVLLVVAAVSVLLARSFSRPYQNLLSYVDRLGETYVEGREVTSGRGVLSDRAWVDPRSEVGTLARALNDLLDERDKLQDALIANRDLMASDQARRQHDVELTASIGTLVAASTDVVSLAQDSVDLLREHYSLYYAGLYLVDDASRWAVLCAGAGDPGRDLLAQAHRVAVGTSLVGQCVATGRVQLERDLSTVAERADDYFLPYARSEIALPLRSRGAVFGVMVADSYQSDTFDDELVVAMRVIADQVAVAIDGLRLYAEGQAADQRLQRAYGELTRQSWLDALGTRVGGGYEAMATGIQLLPELSPETWISYQREAWAEEHPVVAGHLDSAGVSTQRCVLPIRSRDEVIGVLDVSKLAADGDWTRIELEELGGLADQLGQTLENARLYEAAQQRAVEEELVGGATRRLRETLDVDTVLQTAVQELRTLLDLDGVEIRVAAVDVSVEEPEA